MTKKNEIILASGIAAAFVIGGIVTAVFRATGDSSDSDESIYVSAISEINGTDSAGAVNRYSGKIEAQETKEIEKDNDKTVKEILVSEGDEVEVGTELFSYDTDEMQMKLSQAEIDLESLNNDINSYNNQITTLEKEKRSAGSDDKLNYTIQIQEVQNDILRAEYNIKSKNIEIEQLKNSIENATVTSEIAGIVKEINANGETDSNTGEAKPLMTIMATGNFRVKGSINETNAAYLSEGLSVIIRSRIDESQTWTGVISKIDYENPNSDNNNNNYYTSGDTSSSYPFYVELDSADGLMLGQHVFIEPDYGQSETKDGLWLMESYIITEGNDAYVWAMNGKNKLEKRSVELGEYDENLMSYEIVSGLTEDDYIAWPNSRLEEGMCCTISSVSDMITQGLEEDGSSDDGYADDGSTDDGSVDDGFTDDGSVDDGSGDDGSVDDGSGDDGSVDDGSVDDGSIDNSASDGDSAEGSADENLEGTEG